MLEPSVKIGLICVGLEGERNDLAKRFLEKGRANLIKSGVTVVNPEAVCTLSKEEVEKQTKECIAEGADALVYEIGTWILADHVVDAVRNLKVPYGIWGIPEPASFSSVGANVLHGALGEMGMDHRLFYGMPDNERVLGEIFDFARAAGVKRELEGCRLGMIGGRTISAYPTAADPSQIKEIFGVEVEHIDQLVVLEKARKVPIEKSMELVEKVKSRYGKVDVEDRVLIRSVNIYCALKEVAEEYGLQMLTIKCIGEFMDHYNSCCLALSMLNDEGFTAGCQCNLNALISSYILTRLSGQPVFFGDINVVLEENSTVRLINCGSIPGKLAGGDRRIELVTQYEYMGDGSGACTLFCCKPGEVTFGTLGRVNGEYEMNIATGTAYEEPISVLKKVRRWAQGFVHLDGDPMTFYENIRCNHSVMCYGRVEKALFEFCRLCGIRIRKNQAPAV